MFPVPFGCINRVGFDKHFVIPTRDRAIDWVRQAWSVMTMVLRSRSELRISRGDNISRLR
jgi:hypothetical protein